MTTPNVLKKLKEYAQAKTVLKEKKIRFHNPYPAKLSIFYEGETVPYTSAEEVTKDMKARGLQVDIIRPQQTLLECLLRQTWTTKTGRGSPGGNYLNTRLCEKFKTKMNSNCDAS
ncbi:hypothetical protein cypCar_00018426 [Cyprinus carpio]|nr:hypothetical protein cypCar_00018426 [Cyprinus carpio]